MGTFTNEDVAAIASKLANDINNHVCETILLALMQHTPAATLVQIIAGIAADAVERNPAEPYSIPIANFAGTLKLAANDLQRDCNDIDNAAHRNCKHNRRFY